MEQALPSASHKWKATWQWNLGSYSLLRRQYSGGYAECAYYLQSVELCSPWAPCITQSSRKVGQFAHTIPLALIYMGHYNPGGSYSHYALLLIHSSPLALTSSLHSAKMPAPN